MAARCHGSASCCGRAHDDGTRALTTRDEVRRSVAAERADRSDATRGLAAGAAASLPERLLAARERKGVDLYRAERDTKIRARYLAALERGDYRELPGAVYTKGFLRNYALYLGLDADDVLLQWRRERGRRRDPQAGLAAAPRPIAAPRKGLTFSPGLVVFALLLVAVVAFGAYLGVQLLRFAKPPTIAVTAPAAAVTEVDEDTTSYVFEGTTIPGGAITIKTADQTLRTNADSTGEWSYAVDLRRGENTFEISATDPSTGKVAEVPVERVITVPFVAIEAPKLGLDQPADGATFENGAIPVQGTATNVESVVVTRELERPGRPARRGRGQPGPAAGAGARHGARRRRRHVQPALRPDLRALGAGRHRDQPRGQDHDPDPERGRGLQRRQRRRLDQGRPRLAQGLGRRQGRRAARRRRPGLRQRQDPDVQRQGRRSRSARATPRRRTSRSTARTSAASRTRATRAPG